MSAIDNARTLIEALPFIKNFQNQTLVIKYGGSLMLNEESKRNFCKDVALLKLVGINPVIVHGGGKEISAWLEKIGKKTEFIEGLRVTDEETMEITEMVLSGKINSDLVACINQEGGKAVGLSGRDANLFQADLKKLTDNDLGLVGEIKKVDPDLLNTLSKEGYTPVISCVGTSRNCEPLNINADEVAAAVASALKAEKLVYLTDVDGILKEGELIDFLELKDAEELIKDPEIKGGMIPKLGFSISAIKNNVGSVHIINGGNEHAILLEVLTNDGVGTMIKHKRN
ncbi:UNVERIFIED_CONTAM: hypothetical protein GTU68_022228 [Idotea baltica]|nr:hypothetical protein [Idotea baltica]